MFMRVARRAGDQREAPPGQPDDIAIAHIDRVERQLIPPVAPAGGIHQTFADQFGQDHGEDLARDILRRRDRIEPHRPLPMAIGQVLKRADRITGFLAEHAPRIKARPRPQCQLPEETAPRTRSRPPLTELAAQGHTLPTFEPVPRKHRHDGWTPERQRAFIHALADTGSVSRAARHVNMSPEGAYYLRRQPGSEQFRRAWEAALDFGVQRLKDIAYERAIDGQLSPVFVAGKLKGFRRIRNDRLLMFCLRMNARDEHGRRLSASYFDPNAARLSGSVSPSPSGEGLGWGTSRIAGSVTMPALSRAEKDDINAAILDNFDPVRLTLPEIEAMQTMLAEAAARHRAEEDGPVDGNPQPDFIQLREGKEWMEAGEIEGLFVSEDALEPFLPDGAEEDWRDLDQEPPEVLSDAKWLERAGWGKKDAGKKRETKT